MRPGRKAERHHPFSGRTARTLPLLLPISPGLPNPCPGRSPSKLPPLFLYCPLSLPCLPLCPRARHGPAGSRASVGLSLRTARRPWRTHISVSKLVWPSLSHSGPFLTSLDPSAPISGGSPLPNSPALSSLGVRSAGSPSVPVGRPLLRPPPSRLSPFSGPPSGSA